jgi:N-acetylglutamate synthase-like GNAT family acetyltransferase
MRFRLADINDAEAITRVINAGFKRAENFFIDRDRIDVEGVRNFLQTGEFLVAEDNKKMDGCVYVERRSDRGYIGLLAVDPARQKGGLGSELMVAAENRCRELGCRAVDLQIVNLRRELPEFYGRRGYIETGTAPFPSDVVTKLPCHFIKMSKPLV